MANASFFMMAHTVAEHSPAEHIFFHPAQSSERDWEFAPASRYHRSPHTVPITESPALPLLDSPQNPETMLFKARSAAVYGLDASIIDVEVDFSAMKTQEDHF